MSNNTWPGGHRHALDQSQHEDWNATHWPGTRQICTVCGEPTTYCEEEGYYNDEGDPHCYDCATVAGLRGGDDE